MDRQPLRVILFADRDTALLIHAREGEVVELPELRAPFDKATITDSAAKLGLNVRVTVEPRCGRWSDALRRRDNDVKAVLNQQVQRDNILRAIQKSSNGKGNLEELSFLAGYRTSRGS